MALSLAHSEDTHNTNRYFDIALGWCAQCTHGNTGNDCVMYERVCAQYLMEKLWHESELCYAMKELVQHQFLDTLV